LIIWQAGNQGEFSGGAMVFGNFERKKQQCQKVYFIEMRRSDLRLLFNKL
jgi:hypothetical protein